VNTPAKLTGGAVTLVIEEGSCADALDVLLMFSGIEIPRSSPAGNQADCACCNRVVRAPTLGIEEVYVGAVAGGADSCPRSQCGADRRAPGRSQQFLLEKLNGTSSPPGSAQ